MTKKLNSGVYIIKGAKWWDKIYGNTYFSSYVLDENGNEVLKVNFTYGYGDHWFDSTKRELLKMARKNAKIKVIKRGCEYLTKKEVKNFWY